MDHYPFYDAERQALITDICAILEAQRSVVSGVPPLLPPANRFVLRYGVLICTICGLAKEWCRGHASAPDAQSTDGAESGLARRIRDAQKGR